MANAERGEVDLKAGAETYTLRLSINAVCTLEDHLGRPINSIAGEISSPDTMRLATLRAILWAAVQGSRPGFSVEDAGEVIGTVGVPAAMGAVAEAFAKGFPQGDGGKTKGARPPKVAGNGTAS